MQMCMMTNPNANNSRTQHSCRGQSAEHPKPIQNNTKSDDMTWRELSCGGCGLDRCFLVGCGAFGTGALLQE